MKQRIRVPDHQQGDGKSYSPVRYRIVSSENIGNNILDSELRSKCFRSPKYRVGRGKSFSKNWTTLSFGLLLIWILLNRGLLFRTLCRSITLRIRSLPEYESLPGRLWRGSIPMNKTVLGGDGAHLAASSATIELVISHCNLPLDWIFEWSASAKAISNITIVSKCNEPVVGAPPNANVVRLPNVGRCDHSYAHFLAENYERLSARSSSENDSNKNSFVVFIKDSDNSNRDHYARHRSLGEMIQIGQELGFACHEEPSWVWSPESIFRLKPVCRISTYHNWTVLQEYTLKKYARLRRDDNSAFSSQTGSTLGEYAAEVGIETPSMPVVPVCYGGNFMVKRNQLTRQPKALWQRMAQSLDRADNIAEGHFVERLWAALLARPIEKRAMETILQQYSDSCHADKNYVGILTK